MPPLEAWEKVLLDTDAYSETIHGKILCTDCHAGKDDPNKDTAHTDLIHDPSEDPGSTCGNCHPNLIEDQTQSLHYTLEGYTTSLSSRADPESWEHIEEMMGNHCLNCHATCGQCHVSQPNSVGGGLLMGHLFAATPPMSRTCTACHGSRVGNEYLGKNEGLRGDIHFRQGRMACVDCHSSNEMHGQPPECSQCHENPVSDVSMPSPSHRYEGLQAPKCETCHITVITGLDGIDQHDAHGSDLSCQVCHSIPYKSCDGCHTSLTEEGIPYFESEGSYLTFYIGRNPRPSYERPYRYVLLRHVPISPTSFEYYGEDLLTNIESLPTWLYATPHNIQLETPQNESCNACHGNADIFLTVDKVSPAERTANQSVIVDQIPSLIPEEEESSQ